MYRYKWQCCSAKPEARKYPVYIEGKKYLASIGPFRCGRIVTFRRFFTKYEVEVKPYDCGDDCDDLLRIVRTAQAQLCARLEDQYREAAKWQAELTKLAEWDGGE